MKPENSLLALQEKLDFTEINKKEKQELSSFLRKASLLFTFSAILTVANDPEVKGKPSKLLKETFKSVWILIGGQFLASSIFYQPMNSLMPLLTPKMPKFLRGNKFILFEEIMQSYAKIRDKLHTKDQEKLDNELLKLRNLATSPHESHSSAGNCFDAAVAYFQMIISIYDRDKKRSFSREKLPNTIKDLDNFLTTTYPKNKDNLVNYLRPIITSNIFKHNYRPRALLLIGASGVGKTHLIRNTFDKLEVNTVFLSSTNLTPETQKFGNHDITVFKKEDMSSVASQIHRFSTIPKSSQYTALILDEIDKRVSLTSDGKIDSSPSIPNNLSETLLSITEPKSQYWFDNSIDAHLDMRYVILVFIANQDIFSNTPFERRMEILHVENVTPEIKTMIAEDKIKEYCQEFGITLNKEQRLYLDKMIKNDNKPGAANLIEEIKKYISNLQNTAEHVELFKDTPWAANPKEMLISFKLQEAAKKFAHIESAEQKPSKPTARQRLNSI